MWVANYAILAIANVFVIYNYSMDTWVIFKTAGTIGLTVLTAITQAIWIGVHLSHKDTAKEETR
jgi:intracellular septation protein A